MIVALTLMGVFFVRILIKILMEAVSVLKALDSSMMTFWIHAFNVLVPLMEQ